MKRLHLFVLFGLITSLVQAQSAWPFTLDETFGKTESQILAMGRTKWGEYAASQSGGSSTAGMATTEYAFGTALKRSNDKRLEKASAGMRSLVKALRPALASLEEAMVEHGASYSGGGTMWTPIRAGALANTEELVLKLLNRDLKAKPRVTSDVTKELDKRLAWVRRDAGELDDFKGSGYGSAVATKALKSAKGLMVKISALLKSRPRKESDLVLDHCLKVVSRYESQT